MQILREDLDTHVETHLSLDIAVKELKIYDMAFYQRYFDRGGMWLTDKYLYKKSDN